MKYNLHTHTFYCRHGEGTVQQVIETATNNGFELFGISEHCPYPSRILEDNFSRMFYPDKVKYENEVRTLGAKAKIKVLLGYECDIWPGEDGYIKEVCNSVDYAFFGVHFYPGANGEVFTPFKPSIKEKGNLRIYTDIVIKSMESGSFLFAAHPDVFFYGYQGEWNPETKAASKDILEAAVSLHFPIEVNSNGIWKSLTKGLDAYLYPNENFWQMASEMGANCIMNSDAHTPENIYKYYDKLEDFVKKMKLHMLEPSFVNGKLVLS